MAPKKDKAVITDVRIRKVNKEDTGLRAYASITLNDAFVIHNLKVIEGKNGLFVSMPQNQVGEKYLDIAHPITPETREVTNSAVLAAYQEALDNEQ